MATSKKRTAEIQAGFVVVIGLAILAVWAGILDETVLGTAFEWIGDRLLAGLEGISSWVADSWEARTGNG